ncbi:hypothetical protein HYC85_030260 [Camellia sinensis]|uniref:Uncharacterized protein n=1 Tax=Camellia sinensis TaxID=4442 RepID=A0A7J7G0D8_CAMSI|nr:hypothetical protein HYC85_030260 [Camellia sinensis]
MADWGFRDRNQPASTPSPWNPSKENLVGDMSEGIIYPFGLVIPPCGRTNKVIR